MAIKEIFSEIEKITSWHWWYLLFGKYLTKIPIRVFKRKNTNHIIIQNIQCKTRRRRRGGGRRRKGERRKSVVCDAILKGNKNAVCYQYTRDVVPTLNSYIVSSDNPQELLGEKLLNEVQLSNPNMLVIYTNEKQAKKFIE